MSSCHTKRQATKTVCSCLKNFSSSATEPHIVKNFKLRKITENLSLRTITVLYRVQLRGKEKYSVWIQPKCVT